MTTTFSSKPPRMSALAAKLLALCGMAAICSCSVGPAESADPSDDSFSTGLEALAVDAESDETISEELPTAEEGVSLSAVLAKADRAHRREADHTYQEFAPPAEEPKPEPVRVAAAPPPAPPPAPAPPPLSRSERIAKLAGELSTTLRTDAPQSEEFRNALSLAALSISSPEAGGGDTDLSDAERRVVTSVRDLLASLASAQGDADGAAKAFLHAAEGLDSNRGMKISRVELCSSVNGFGRYEPMSSTFAAGRANRVIVYTELDRFAHRPSNSSDPGRSAASSDELWAVEISQELRMTHEGDGSMQWRTPEEKVIEVARNRRRDFYLVQSVSLPQTLSVGNYLLKVIVRDKVSGFTDERIVPVRMVADPTLVKAR